MTSRAHLLQPLRDPAHRQGRNAHLGYRFGAIRRFSSRLAIRIGPRSAPRPITPNTPGAAAILMTAATEVLADVFGDETSFTIESPTLPGKPRTFARFSDLSADTVNARVYIGFHFRHSSMVGAASGRQIAQLVLRNFLLPVPNAVSGQAQANGTFQVNLLSIGARPYVIQTSSDW